MLPDASFIRKEPEKKRAGLFSRFSKSESAAATAILAILFLGLVFTIFSVVRLEYAPEWKNDAEQDHTYDIWNNMVGVKVRIDMLSQLMESGNYSTDSSSATVPFNIGGGEIPVFDPSKSDGKLEINTERCIMTIKPYTNQTVNPYCPPLECDGISCYSGNRQYPDQIFRYENGALILADGKSSIMKQSPAFSIENKTGNYNVTIRAVQLFGKPDSISSNAIIPLRLTGLQSMPIYNSSSIDIKGFDLIIATKYPDAWFVYLNETARDKGLVNETDYTIKLDPNSVRFSFLPNSSKTLERLYVSKSSISAELIPLRYQNVMKLNQWYCFNAVSDPTIDLSRLMDCGLPVDLSIQNTDKALSEYSENNVFKYNLGNSTLESIFGFNGFTEFESQPSSVTILMIYHPEFDSPAYQSMSVSGIPLSKLTGKDKKYWYLYKQTVPCTSITDPSKLTYYIKINEENGNKKIDIDYLAVYLS